MTVGAHEPQISDGSAETPSRALEVGALRHPQSEWRRIVRGLTRHPLGLIGIVLVGIVIVLAIFAPLIAPYAPNAQQPDQNLMGLSLHHLMGTDEFGRDEFSRVIYGGRIALELAFAAVGAGAAAGTLLGLLAGYVSGWFDIVTSRLWDAVFAFPGILLGLLIVAIRGPGFSSVALAVAVSNIPVFARLARASTLKERELEYVAAAITLGAGRGRVLVRHILPNCLAPLIVQFSISAGAGVLLGAALSFVGLGIQLPTAEWGSMLNESMTFIYQAPWLALFPGVALAALTVGLIFVADALNGELRGSSAR